MQSALHDSEALLAGQKEVLELIVRELPLEKTLDALVRIIERRAPGVLGSILLLDEDGEHVRHGAAPNLPAAYVSAIDGEPIGSRTGAWGTAAYRKEPVLVEDIATDPLWEVYRDSALGFGLRACWSTPILDADREVLGTFAMYYREPGLPDEQQLRLIEVATHAAAIAITRARSEEALLRKQHQSDRLEEERNERERQLSTLISTERKQAELEVRESEERLRAAVRAGNVGLWDWDLRTDEIFFSPEWKRQIGYEDHEITNDFSEWESRVHPEDLERATATIRSFIEKPWPDFSNEFRLHHKDGSYRQILAQGALVYDDDGKPVRMLGSHIDITERKRAEEALRRSEHQLRLFVEHSPAALAMFDREMNYLVASRRWHRDFRLGDEDLVGRSHYDVFPDLPERWKEVHRRCLAGAVERREEDPFPRPDGHTDWVRWEVRPWHEPDGAVGGLIFFSEVITEAVEARNRIRESEERLRLSTELGDVAVWEYNFATSRMSCSPNHDALYGLDRQSHWDMSTFVEVIHPDDRERSSRIIERCVAVGGPNQWEFDFRVIHPNRSIHWLMGRGQVVERDDHGHGLVMRGCLVDVTKRKAAEESLEEAKQRLQVLSHRLLEIQETERKSLARELHDEIGQTLTATKIYLQTLRQFPEPAAIASRLDDSIAIVDRALGQVRSMSLALRPPLLDDLGLGAALRWLADQHVRSGGLDVEVHGESDERFDGKIEIACFRVAQEALTNIVRHAGASSAVIEVVRRDHALHLHVSDDGTGFDVDSARSRVAHGESLGLLNMEERAAFAGGEIEWRSTPGQGTGVHAWFPL